MSLDHTEVTDISTLTDDEVDEFLMQSEDIDNAENEQVDEIEQDETSAEDIEDNVDAGITTEDDEVDETVDDTTEDTVDDTDATEDENKEEVDVTDEVDTELATSQYAKLLEPFKANGHMMQVNSAEEAIKLMQKGVGLNRRLEKLKPSLKIMNMLQSNGLLDVDKVSYLIDLDKKNPEAITKLINDSGIDPLDLDDESNKSYTPSNYSVADTNDELDSVLEDIKDNDSFNTTADIISNQWDEESREVLNKNPNIIRVVDQHVQNGTYTKVVAIVEKERMLGNISSSTSDVEAYGAVAARLAEQDSANNKNVSTIKSKVDKVAEASRNKRRKAATKTNVLGQTKTSKAQTDVYKMSDEEFMKQFDNGAFG